MMFQKVNPLQNLFVIVFITFIFLSITFSSPYIGNSRFEKIRNPAYAYEESSSIFSICTWHNVYENKTVRKQRQLIDCSVRNIRNLDFTETTLIQAKELKSSHFANQVESSSEIYGDGPEENLTSEFKEIDLNLRMNSLSKIRKEFYDMAKHISCHIQYLDLSYNRIKHIDLDAFVPLTKLKALSLQYNSIKTIPKLSTLSNLLILNLENNYYLKSIPGARLAKSLTHLLLASTPLRHISRNLLRNQTNLEILDISNGLGTEIRQRTMDHNAFDDLHNLTVLNMSHTNWRISDITSHLFRNIKKLRIFKAKRCYLRSPYPFIEENNDTLGNLEELDLSGNPFNAENVTSRILPNLKKLILNYTIIKMLPENAFQGMQRLETLHISGVKLSNSNTRTLNNNPTIRDLDISQNKLLEIPVLSPLIENINLRRNRLTTVRREIFFMANALNELDLSNQKITSIEDNAFYDSVTRRAKKLTFLNLKRNKIRTICYNQFIGLDNLKELHLEENIISLLENLPLPRLEVLHLSKNKLQYINGYFFSTMPHLLYLDLSKNFLTYFDTGNGLHNLQHLNLNNNNLTSPLALSSLEKLHTLSLEHNMITELSTHTFKNCCKLLNTLSVAHNRVNKIRDRSFYYLNNLTELDISHNKLGHFPQEALEDVYSLQRLSLGNNGMAKFLTAPFLNLKTLNLHGNKIQSLGDTDLANLLPSIEYLDLSSNNLKHIQMGLLDRMTHLKKINIKENSFRCPCNEDNIYLDSYKYVKQWLLDFAESPLSDTYMLKDIESDKSNALPSYYCMKDNDNIIQFFKEPCETDVKDMMKNLLKTYDLQKYEDYFNSIGNSSYFGGNEDGSTSGYDFYENYEL